MDSNFPDSIIIFDTTMRDGELAPNIEFSLQQKITLAQLLEEVGVDVIEIGYPGQSAKDFKEFPEICRSLKKAVACGLAGTKELEISRAAQCLKLCLRGRIHTYTNVRVNSQNRNHKEIVLQEIESSISLARRFCEDVQWSAFDAPRSEPEFLFKAIEIAIESGATTVNIPDSLGLCNVEQFSQLMADIFNNVSNLDKAVVSVHCHNDKGLAVSNSLAALEWGVGQIECSINGLGARKGNADLIEIVEAIVAQNKYRVNCDRALLYRVSEWLRDAIPAWEGT
ncbi:MAG: 2-isopropylmalate synthase [Cyanobacteriota bacterium]|nr:2-isopropylmalate synthase [Cyanobacteriota bacterium]